MRYCPASYLTTVTIVNCSACALLSFAHVSLCVCARSSQWPLNRHRHRHGRTSRHSGPSTSTRTRPPSPSESRRRMDGLTDTWQASQLHSMASNARVCPLSSLCGLYFFFWGAGGPDAPKHCASGAPLDTLNRTTCNFYGCTEAIHAVRHCPAVSADGKEPGCSQYCARCGCRVCWSHTFTWTGGPDRNQPYCYGCKAWA